MLFNTARSNESGICIKTTSKYVPSRSYRPINETIQSPVHVSIYPCMAVAITKESGRKADARAYNIVILRILLVDSCDS